MGVPWSNGERILSVHWRRKPILFVYGAWSVRGRFLFWIVVYYDDHFCFSIYTVAPSGIHRQRRLSSGNGTLHGTTMLLYI